MPSTSETLDFDKKYVSTNIKPGAPPYSPQIVERFINELQAVAPEELKTLSYAILVCRPFFQMICS